MANTGNTTTIRVLVWAGRPGNDTKLTRQAGLLLCDRNKLSGTLIHAANYGDEFQVETSYEYGPLSSRSLAGQKTVAVIPHQIDLVTSMAQNTPITIDASWNCQNWVGDALKRLESLNFITVDEREGGIDGMIDVLVQAPDDDPLTNPTYAE